MKKLALLTAMLFSLVACDSGIKDQLKETVVKLVTNSVTPAVVNTLQCEAVDEVKVDVEAAIRKVVGADEKSLVGNLCKSIVATAVPQLLGAAINPDWKCAATDVQASIKLVTDAACDKLQ